VVSQTVRSLASRAFSAASNSVFVVAIISLNELIDTYKPRNFSSTDENRYTPVPM
jgi:hypothetical protein